jgi:hypothetical protein
MNPAVAVRAAVFVLLLAAAAGAQTPAPPAASVFPPDFKIVGDHRFGEAVLGEATKANSACPKPHSDPQIRLTYSWQPNPVAAQMLDLLAKSPEDPPSTTSPRTDPAGKGPHRGGVLTWHKTTVQWIGSGQNPDMILVDGTWVGVLGDGLLGVGVRGLCGSQAQAIAWIDSMVDKVYGKKTR